MCVVLDGKPRGILSHMTKVVKTWERPYVTLRFKMGTLKLAAGFIDDVPVVVIEKVKNAGKKDSLVLCFDLFNAPRSNLPLYTRLLREQLEQDVLPILTHGHEFNGFNMMFCTDADSTIHKGALYDLATTLVQDENVIAACGVVLVELEPGYRWSVWNLYQQYQVRNRCLSNYILFIANGSAVLLRSVCATTSRGHHWQGYLPSRLHHHDCSSPGNGWCD
jgi:hypothetical protein